MGHSHPTNQLFSLQATNGVLRTASSFDFEANASSYVLSVKAIDSGGASTEGNFTITLVNDASDDPFVPAPITDANFQDAVNLWFSDEANATHTYGHIRDWNASTVTDMSEAFMDRSTFNEDISGWGVGNVTKMTRLFKGASSFNQPIGDWDMSSVRWMGSMFFGASSFNKPIGDLDVSSVIDMNQCFFGQQVSTSP